jgi:hypothetical protein
MTTSGGGAIDLGYYVMPKNLYEATDIQHFSVLSSDTMAGASGVIYYFKVVPR